MYKEHRVCKTVKSNQLPLWRYLDFWKFLNLLETKSLFFSNSENLGDNNEGRIPQFILKEYLEDDKKNDNHVNEELIKHIEKDFRKSVLISSWSFSERESFAMWKMYAGSNTGIAISTDLDSLKSSFINTERDINIGEVNYINNKNFYYSLSNALFPFVTKLGFYEYENEIRCLTKTTEYENTESRLVKVDLNSLIKRVYISPNSNPEFLMLIKLLRREYKLNFEVCLSEINDSWL